MIGDALQFSKRTNCDTQFDSEYDAHLHRGGPKPFTEEQQSVARAALKFQELVGAIQTAKEDGKVYGQSISELQKSVQEEMLHPDTDWGKIVTDLGGIAGARALARLISPFATG